MRSLLQQEGAELLDETIPQDHRRPSMQRCSAVQPVESLKISVRRHSCERRPILTAGRQAAAQAAEIHRLVSAPSEQRASTVRTPHRVRRDRLYLIPSRLFYRVRVILDWE